MHSFKLQNPFGDQPAIFEWQENFKVPSDDSNEIFQIIKLLSEDHDELKHILKQYIDGKKNDPNSHNYYDKLKGLCEEFNEWAIQMSESRMQVDQDERNKLTSTATKTQIKYIMHLTYNRSVTNPDKLNDYEPFSPQVYGETSFDLIDEMLKRVNLNENDVFVDLGSGVGNVVLHVAAVTKCKRCYGFEKAHWPAFYADRMKNEFKFWMNFFGKRYSDFQLYKGDFLSDEEYIEPEDELCKKRKLTMNDYVKEIINEANLIFVNNYAFGAEVDHQLKLRFCNMLEGSLIVSSKPFCPLNFRINSRNLNDIGTILNVTEYEPISGRVSWTDRPITYYFHKLDRTLLEKYFERLKNPGKCKEDNHHEKKKSLSPNSASNSSSSSPSDQDHNREENGASSRGRGRRRTVDTDDASSIKSSNLKEVDTQSDEAKQLKKKKKKRKPSVTSHNRADSTNPNKTEKKAKKSHTSPITSVQRKSRSKSLDKDVLKTLEKMHTEVVKSSRSTTNAKLDTKPQAKAKALSGSTTTNTTTDENLNNDSTNMTTTQLSEFNLKTMTKLTNENLDKRLLKDCQISSKLFDNNCKLDSSKCLPEEIVARKELGDDIVDALDTYLIKCKRQYLKYLLHLNSNEYKKSIMAQIDKEQQFKNDLLNRKEKIEQQTSNLLKANVNLLKMRAAELGIKDLKSPHELIQCAQDILTNHQMLMNKINTLQTTVNKLELKTTINNSIQTNTKSPMNRVSTQYKHQLNEESSSPKSTKTSGNKLNNSKDDLFMSRKSNQKDANPKLDMLMSSARAESASTLKSFKIPKKELELSSTSSLASQHPKTLVRNITPPGSPSSTSTSSSHSSSSGLSKTKQKSNEQQNPLSSSKETSSNKNNEMQFLTECSNSIELNRQTSCDSPVSSSSTSSLTNSNLNMDCAYQNSKSYPNYYHPKKNQFRQYMMESNSSTKSSMFNKESYQYNDDHTGWSSS